MVAIFFMSTNAYAITIETDNSKHATAPSGYSLSNETYTVSVSPDDDSYTELVVKNIKPGQLPITGGSGTVLFSILGLIVIGSAFVYYRIKKSKKINDAI